MRTSADSLFTPSAFLLSLMIGIFVGSIGTAWLMHRPEPMVIIDDQVVRDVPVVHIEGIRDSALIGTVQGEVRLVAGDEIVLLNGSGGFAITDRDLLTNIIMIKPPEGMNFVASKRGTKYYPLDSAGAGSISPANRIFFRTAGEAEKAGYKK